MNMADLTTARGVQGIQCKQCEAFLLKTGSADPETVGLFCSGLRESLAKRYVCLGAARLIKLSLRGDSGHLRA